MFEGHKLTDDNPSNFERRGSQSDLTAAPHEGSPGPGGTASPNPAALIGGLYEIIGVLGKGGMGSVLKARHQRLQNKIYAIKVLNPVLMATDPTLRQRFELEAQATSKLTHPNLVTVFDYGFTPEGAPYLVMEFLDGFSLDHILKSETRVSIEELLPVFIQLTKALQYIHTQNVVHRDLKPHNIMVQVIGNEPYAKLIDLGIAKVFTDDGTTAQHLTATGVAYGSPYYMSPEQCKGEKIDLRSDIYSFGCVMYECLAGRPPFQGENSLQTVFKQVSEQAPAIECKTEFERELAIVIERCMQKTAAHRFQNAGELLIALGKIGENSRQSNRSAESHAPATSGEPSRPPLKIQFQSQAQPQLQSEPQPLAADAALSRSQRRPNAQPDAARSQSQRRPSPQPYLAPPPAAPILSSSSSNSIAIGALVSIGLIAIGWFAFQIYNQLTHAPPAQQANSPENPSPIDYTAKVLQLKKDTDKRYDLIKERLQRMNQPPGQVQNDVDRYWNNVHTGMDGLNQQLEKQNAQYRTGAQ